MRLATIRHDGNVYAGVERGKNFYAFQKINPLLPDNMLQFIEGYDIYKNMVGPGIEKITPTCSVDQLDYLPPLPNPGSFRDFGAFEEHLMNILKKSGVSKLPDAFYQFPAFYFSNHRVMRGSAEPVKLIPGIARLDFEFEIGFIIGKAGMNIPAAEAGDYIFGLTILNDWSIRDVQGAEMSTGLGPAKAKDYATSIGPVIVTKDEIDAYLCKDDPTRYDLRTKLTYNGKVLRENNVKSIYHSFVSMVERASQNVMLYPGDLFGSGTTGGGAINEYPDGEIPFLTPGDIVEMEVESIGVLRNVVF